MRTQVLTILLIVLWGFVSNAQDVWMHPNKGQWDNRIEYKIDLNQGELLIGKDGFIYSLNDVKEKRHSHHEAEIENHHDEHDEYNFHIIRSTFLGSSWNGELEQGTPSDFYRNYLYGNDPSAWRSKIHSYQEVRMKEFYTDIDLVLSTEHGGMEYSFYVSPGADPKQIVLNHEGQDKVSIDDDGNLHIGTRFGDIMHSRPLAWTDNEGRKSPVFVEFLLNEEGVSFSLPDGYDENLPLIIDPDLTFSSFTGSTADNWGMSATPDADGNLFGGSSVFNTAAGTASTTPGSYPVTTGAYSSAFNGGSVDIGISKFNAIGTNLLYSTYLGGLGDETPNSMVADDNGELFIFGLTSSPDFPMAGASYDNSYAGGPALNGSSNGLGFQDGSDLFVARLSADGTTLLASTYVGGTGTDGMNTTGLQYNYGDQYRGEIILDGTGSLYISSTTQSTDFPTVSATQPALSGPQDAVIFKMPIALNTLTWSTFLGGVGNETGNSVQISSTGDVYMAGGTNSASMGFSAGNDLTFNGGISDGYIAKFNGTTGLLIGGTYMGDQEYDQAYFVQLDITDNVYVLGQSESDWGVTPGHYGIPNSGQFIRKYSNDLTTIEWTTMIGAGTGHVEISPTAFLVSDCYDIYLSGWGGQLNVNGSQATNSTSNGFPITSDAFQALTNGSNFYIAVLDEDAMNLKYGTFMGGTNSSSNHVDGGTSRFDKSGRIYHAVCGSCSSPQNGFTTTTGAWSNTDNSLNCNMAVFKFELSTIEATVSNPDPIVCIPDPVIFNNNSSNGNAFFWDFGDNSTSTEVNPVHFYTDPGTYDVTLVVIDTNGCFSPDSIEFSIYIGDFQGGVIQPPGAICPGDAFQFEAYGGVNYEWTPAQFLDDPTSATPTAIIDQTTDFQVIISDSCGIDTVNVTLLVHLGSSTASNDTSICIGNDVNLFATGGVSYLWSPPDYLDDPTSATPTSIPDASITYTVDILTSSGCELEETVVVDVYYTPPVPIIPDTIKLCEGNTATITVSGGETYTWYPAVAIDVLDGPVVNVNPTTDQMYYCLFSNPCGEVLDSVYVEVVVATITAGYDTIICPGETTPLWGMGGLSYVWSPYQTLNNAYSSLVYATPTVPTMYYVTGTDQYGCIATDSVFVDLYPKPFIQTVPDVYAFYGDAIQLGATSTTTGPYVWSPAEYLSCIVCESPTAIPNQNYFYVVSYTDENGCSATDSVHIFYDPILYVPNTFTPNEDELSFNEIFKAEGGNIATFEMLIFNRWGELVYTITSLDEGWDGTYKGANAQDGTYTWKVKLTDLEGEEHLHVGHVNLLR